MTTAAQAERYQRKARCVVAAWEALFRSKPTLRALVRAMAVAEFESRMGDSRGWKDEHNWGAIQKRALTSAELATLRAAAISAQLGDAALPGARALLAAGPDEALHIDSSPKGGKYFAWFWSFASDDEAARKFLQVLFAQRPKVRAAIEAEDVREVARAMYETGYYEGFHRDDPEANVRDYAKRLAELEPTIRSALAMPAQTCTSCPVPSLATPGASPLPRPLASDPAPLLVARADEARSPTRQVAFIIGAITLLMFTIVGRAR